MAGGTRCRGPPGEDLEQHGTGRGICQSTESLRRRPAFRRGDVVELLDGLLERERHGSGPRSARSRQLTPPASALKRVLVAMAPVGTNDESAIIGHEVDEILPSEDPLQQPLGVYPSASDPPRAVDAQGTAPCECGCIA